MSQKYRVLINEAVLGRDLTAEQAEALVRRNQTYRNSNGAQPLYLKNGAYRIVADEGPCPPSRFSTGDTNNPYIAAKPGDLASWLSCLDKLQRGPFTVSGR